MNHELHRRLCQIESEIKYLRQEECDRRTYNETHPLVMLAEALCGHEIPYRSRQQIRDGVVWPIEKVYQFQNIAVAIAEGIRKAAKDGAIDALNSGDTFEAVTEIASEFELSESELDKLAEKLADKLCADLPALRQGIPFVQEIKCHGIKWEDIADRAAKIGSKAEISDATISAAEIHEMHADKATAATAATAAEKEAPDKDLEIISEDVIELTREVPELPQEVRDILSAQLKRLNELAGDIEKDSVICTAGLSTESQVKIAEAMRGLAEALRI